MENNEVQAADGKNQLRSALEFWNHCEAQLLVVSQSWDEWLDNTQPEIDNERISALEDKTMLDLLGKGLDDMADFVTHTLGHCLPPEGEVEISDSEQSLAAIGVVEMAIMEAKEVLLMECDDPAVTFWLSVSNVLKQVWSRMDERAEEQNRMESLEEMLANADEELEEDGPEADRTNLEIEVSLLLNPRFTYKRVDSAESDQDWVSLTQFMVNADDFVQEQLMRSTSAFMLGGSMLDFDVPKDAVFH